MTLASLSSPNYAGADLSTWVNAILVEARSGRRFLSVALVLSDTTVACSSGAPGRRRRPRRHRQRPRLRGHALGRHQPQPRHRRGREVHGPAGAGRRLQPRRLEGGHHGRHPLPRRLPARHRQATHFVRAPAGATLRIGANLLLRSNLAIDAPGVTLVGDGGTRSLDVKGTASAATSALASPGTKGNFGLRAATKNVFAVGDWVVVTKTGEADNDGFPKGRATQLFRITVIGGTEAAYDQLTCDRALGFDFTVGPATRPASPRSCRWRTCRCA